MIVLVNPEFRFQIVDPKKNKMSFAGKNVLITGGTTGIGFAIIEVIARDADVSTTPNQ